MRRKRSHEIKRFTGCNDRSNESKGQSEKRFHFRTGICSEKAGIDAGCRNDIPEDMVSQIILKELKSVKEQIDTCPASREDLLAEYKARYEVMSEFAPKLLSAEEVKEILTSKFAEVLATKNKGMIMKTVMGELKGKADGKVINQVVAELTK